MGDVVRYTNGTTGGPVFVDVKDGKILRITPMEFDDSDAASWTISARGQEFTPPRKTTASPWTVAHRSTIYSSKRILTPLKRVDFDPKGERNPQNRGTSGYEPISWDEALDMVADEMIRLHRELGPSAILTTTGSHHMWGNVGYRHSVYQRFMNLVGCCYGAHNPDSWEGWHWGAMHMWGNSHRLGISEQYGLLEDALKHTELIIYWSADPEATCSGVYGAHDSNIRRRWLKDLGVKMIVIDPYLNHTGALLGDKWFSPRMGTDVAFGLAIAFVWLTEGLYDKDYVANRTTDFDVWKDYVLGKSDGVAKSPEWAENESGISARDIRALAREWASKKTMLAAGGPGGMGGASRASYGNEWARTMVALAAMQGLGKPGSNIWGTTSGTPLDCSFMFPGYSEGGISGDCNNSAAGFRFENKMFPNGGSVTNPHTATEGQTVPRLRIPEAMRHENLEWRGKGFCGSHIESQFQKYSYPAQGYPHIGMYYRYGGSFFGTMTETNRYVTAYREGKVPFVVNQAIWFEGETKFADIILPACTNFERWDISEFANCSGYIADSHQFANHRVIVFQHKCIEPLGQSKSDYDIFAELSKRMGLHGAFTMGGKSDLDWVKDYFNATDLPTVISWDDFVKKGYYVVPSPEEKRSAPALRWFAEGRAKDTADWGPAPWDQIKGEGLQTMSGKIEFVASSLKRLEATGTIDAERPAMGPQYLESWEGHHTADLYGKYPLQLVSPHPKFSFHTMGDGKDSWMNEVKDHRILIDGHYYWIMRINTKDAAARGIAEDDLVRAFNDRGSVILAAQVTERVPPGTVHSYESSSEYDALGEPGHSPDRGGCINILTPKRFITPTSTAMANNSCLVQIEKWGGEGLMKTWHMIIDLSLCHDCNDCFLADKDEFVENDFLPYSVGQPWYGQRWMNIGRKERGQYPMVDIAYMPVPCLHCDDAPCIKDSPAGTIYKREDGLVIIDPVKAKGHPEIVATCPYDVIYWNEEAQVAQKCTGCAHLMDDGWKDTRCSQVCPTGTIKLVVAEEDEFAKLVVSENLEVFKPELGAKPRVYYKNLHKWTKAFIGGTAVFSDTDECAEGVRAVITRGGASVGETVSNNYGDFVVDKLEAGEYELTLSAPGYQEYKTRVDLTASVSLGVISLPKA